MRVSHMRVSKQPAAVLLLFAGAVLLAGRPSEAVHAVADAHAGGVAGLEAEPIRSPAQGAQYRWVDVDGSTIPLTDEELIDFLLTAEVVERESIDVGINGIDRLVLEKDGLRLRAGFRDVDITRRNQRVGSEFYLVFRDSYMFECAAYELAKLLGMDSVPPAVRRRIGTTDGSLQLWVEGLVGEGDDFKPPDSVAWVRQIWTMTFFDALIYNVDRNPGNLLSDTEFRLWLIDHTRAFQEKSDPYDVESVAHVERGAWERLQALDDEEIRAALSPYLDSSQVTFLLERRERLVAHIRALIAERTEGAVIF